jgi:hypothetical protein
MKDRFFTINNKSYHVREWEQKDGEGFLIIVVVVLILGFLVQLFYLPSMSELGNDSYKTDAYRQVEKYVEKNHERYEKRQGESSELYISSGSSYDKIHYMGNGVYEILLYVKSTSMPSIYYSVIVTTKPKRTILLYVDYDWKIKNVTSMSSEDYEARRREIMELNRRQSEANRNK